MQCSNDAHETTHFLTDMKKKKPGRWNNYLLNKCHTRGMSSDMASSHSDSRWTRNWSLCHIDFMCFFLFPLTFHKTSQGKADISQHRLVQFVLMAQAWMQAAACFSLCGTINRDKSGGTTATTAHLAPAQQHLLLQWLRNKQGKN